MSRSPAWSVACERAARRSGAAALAFVAVKGLANIGGNIGRRRACVNQSALPWCGLACNGMASAAPPAQMQRPPSTSMHTPLMNAASSLAR